MRPGCFLDLLDPLSYCLNQKTVESVEDLRSLGMKDEDVVALMNVFVANGNTIEFTRLGREEFECLTTFLEETFTTDEIERCIIQPYLNKVKRRIPTWSARHLFKDKFIRIADWALRLGFQQIANEIRHLQKPWPSYGYIR
jgi:hypothetical protein